MKKTITGIDLVSEPSDPEKLLLPGIVFVNPRDQEFGEPNARGFVLFIGWWHFGVVFTYVYIKE